MSGVDNERLKLLSDPFPAGDIEWRVSRAGMKNGKVWCNVLAYITARAIQKRLDDVVGPGNWCNTPLHAIELRHGIIAMQVGISILVDDKWVTKYDVADQTEIEAAKGGFSGAMKRAGAQWGIGRYLYALDEERAEVSEDGKGSGWEWARLPQDKGGEAYYWKPPRLPAWALPREPETEQPVTQKEIDLLKASWRKKFAPKETNRQVLWESFTNFVHSVVGKFPNDEAGFWTQNIVTQVHDRIANTKDANGPSSDVPFD